MSRDAICVKRLVDGPLESVWERTQEPSEHERRDLRFSDIEYLPREEGEPQRFTYATRVGQLSVPFVSATSELALSSRVVAVNGGDSQTGDRAWIRSNVGRATGADSMTYVGIYDRYSSTGRSYLRVTFPLPGSNLTGILRVENSGADGSALVLSSFPEVGNGDDAGLYLMIGGGSVRLPLNETLVVEPDDGGGGVHAVHRVELLGVRVFTLRYDIDLAVGR